MTRLRRVVCDQKGVTLIEMMVGIMLLSILVVVFYTFLFGGERAARNGRQWLELNQTARLALDRLSRELREADLILSIEGDRKIQFQADFDSSGTFVDGTFVPDITPDEKLTYEYDAGANQLLIWSEADPTKKEAIALNVSAFRFVYFGSDPRLDCGPPPGCVSDGVVTAAEIDRFGNNNGVLDGTELDQVTSVVIEMTVARGPLLHRYRTGIELRNMFR